MIILSKLLTLILTLFSFTVTGSFDEAQMPIATRAISPYEYLAFDAHHENRLPAWETLFRYYGRKYNVPWALLAAVAYQESKWDAEAVSYTGVKGLMQLTQSTAKYIGIDDREDPAQSIRGGAFYLRYLYSKTPVYIPQVERWALALAAYNMGWGHVRDARRLAKHLKRNPLRWKDFKKVVPLLEDEKYFGQLRFGYARGRETVQFVDNVLAYYKLLSGPKRQLIAAD